MDGDHYGSQVSELGATSTTEAEEPNFEDFYKSEVNRQNLELALWLDEFMASEEFASYFKRKSRRVDKGTEPDDAMFDQDISVKAEENPQKYAHASLWLEKLQRALERKNVANTIANQKKGIKIIRDKIAEYRYYYLTQKGRKQRQLLEERVSVLKTLQNDYGIHFNLKELSTKPRVVEKIQKIKANARALYKRALDNKVRIIRKILNELRRDQQIEKLRNKTYDYKVKPHGKFIPDLEIVGTAVTLSERPKNEEGEEEAELETADEEEDIEAAESETLGKQKKGKKAKKDKKKGKKNKGKKKKKKKGSKKKKKKKKGSKKSKSKESVALVFPKAPILNKHEKIKPEDNMRLDNLIKDFDRLANYLEDKEAYAIERMLEDNLLYRHDKDLFTKPSKIIFKNFRNGNVYRKGIIITNGGRFAKKIRLERIVWNADIDDELLLEIDPIGIQKLIPGLSTNVTLRFNPETLWKTTEAKVVFVTYKPATNDYKQYILDVICMPFCAAITITPTVVSFKEIPIWRAKKLQEEKMNFKTVVVKNSGNKECRVVISKIFTPITVEQAWRNIISILSIDNEDPKAITSKEVDVNDMDVKDLFPKNLVQECVENVFNTFRFERNIFNVKGNSSVQLKVWFKNIDYEGYHVETYSFGVYERYPDGKLYCIGSQDVVINAETTGHMLRIMPDILDFECCAYDSVYQVAFEIYNPTKISHCVKIKFPKTMREYLQSNVSDAMVHGGQFYKISIKFTPRRDIIENNQNFYDKELCLLEFPVYVKVCTIGHEDTPVMKVDFFAAVTECLGLVLRPLDMTHVINNNGEYLIDMGDCTTMETVYIDLEIVNNTLVPHHYGFLDLPACVTIEPNYGFGRLWPMQSKILRVQMSPERGDLEQPFGDRGLRVLFFRISATTVKKHGSIKKSLNFKRVNKELKKIEDLVSNPPAEDAKLMSDINYLMRLIRSDVSLLSEEPTDSMLVMDESVTSTPSTNVPATYDANIDQDEKVLSVTHYDSEKEKEIDAQNLSMLDENYGVDLDEEYPTELTLESNGIWLRVRIVDVLCDFSHQYVVFPETPCGSRSVMSVELRARKYFEEITATRRAIRHYKARFEIVGDSEEIRAEPVIGELEDGDKIKIFLVANPKTPQHVIEEKARALKIAELIEQKRKEYELMKMIELEKQAQKAAKLAEKAAKLAEKEAKKKGKGKKDKKDDKTSKKSEKSKKDKKDKKGKKKGKGEEEIKEPEVEPEPEFVVDDSEIAVGYFDYYPAEMCVWRDLEPYKIEATFRCTLTYTSDKMEQTEETLYLKASCKVIQPDFIHDLNLQEVNFGTVALGMTATQVVTLQNIQRYSLSPKLSVPSPLGSFNVPEIFQVTVPSEYSLVLPIIFTPEEEKQEIEFFDVINDKTTYPFILRGEGVSTDFTFHPVFTICRLEAPDGGNAECKFDIRNASRAPITVYLTKLCEIEGEIKPKPALPVPKEDKKGKKNKKGNDKAGKKSKKTKSSKGKEKKRPKFSAQLMEDEEYSVANLFEARDPEKASWFEVLGTTSNGQGFTVSPGSSAPIKIRFGNPPLPKEKSKKEKGKKSDKASKSTKGKKSKKSSKRGKKDAAKFYIAKYNLTLGRRTFIKDIIIIAKFV